MSLTSKRKRTAARRAAGVERKEAGPVEVVPPAPTATPVEVKPPESKTSKTERKRIAARSFNAARAKRLEMPKGGHMFLDRETFRIGRVEKREEREPKATIFLTPREAATVGAMPMPMRRSVARRVGGVRTVEKAIAAVLRQP